MSTRLQPAAASGNGTGRAPDDGPISLKQPGPSETTVHCVIKRNKRTSTYRLYLAKQPTWTESGTFLLAARRFVYWTCTEYVISLNADNIPKGSSGTYYFGKVRSNSPGTEFTIYDTVCSQVLSDANRIWREISLEIPKDSYIENVGHVVYELRSPFTVTPSPRRFQCTLQTIPASAMEPHRSAPAPTPTESVPTGFRSKDKDGPLLLKNKVPRWDAQFQCWRLDFTGRIVASSVKNFVLLAPTEPSSQTSDSGEQTSDGKVVLLFAKIGKDRFAMDYCYPLSAFQAFAICLSAFDVSSSLSV